MEERPRGDNQGAAATPALDVPAGLAIEALLDIGLKPVVRELHDEGGVASARKRWAELGFLTEVGDVILEDETTAAMVTDVDSLHTIRPLATHPVVQRAVDLFGRPARLLLLDPNSPIQQWLCERYGAEQAPLQDARPPSGRERKRRAVYVSRDQGLATRARELDRMAADGHTGADSIELGRLLGYPACCVQAFSQLERRWPNRLPIEAAMGRTKVFQGRLNNLALGRFAWISWFPCRYDCAASLELADAAAQAIARGRPQLVAALDAELSRPRLYWSDGAQAALADARWTGPDRIQFGALEPVEHTPEDHPPWAGLDSADRLILGPSGPRFHAGRRTLPHPGSPLLLPFGLGPPPPA